jgi:hypothetical protein
MIGGALLLLLVGCIYGLWRLLPLSARQRQGWSGVWRLACVIGAVRITAFGFGALALRDPGWVQGLGYFLVLLGLPEIALIRAWRFQTTLWVAAGCGLLAASSFLWAAFWQLLAAGRH